jgi:hypothetical protein
MRKIKKFSKSWFFLILCAYFGEKTAKKTKNNDNEHHPGFFSFYVLILAKTCTKKGGFLRPPYA